MKPPVRSLTDLLDHLTAEADHLREIEARGQAAGIDLAVGRINAWLDEELTGTEAAATSRYSYTTLLRYRRKGWIERFTRRELLGLALGGGDLEEPNGRPGRKHTPSAEARSRIVHRLTGSG